MPEANMVQAAEMAIGNAGRDLWRAGIFILGNADLARTGGQNRLQPLTALMGFAHWHAFIQSDCWSAPRPAMVRPRRHCNAPHGVFQNRCAVA